ncbi:MAG: GNAT family N-acetyltransferase [Methanomicrobiaceae archaeon]|nr:GNAT family N-acetyltransferase [Methanomicrobiaceae archaeon]
MNSPVIRIREAEYDDLAGISDLYHDLHEKDLTAPKFRLKAAWEEILSDKRTHMFILFADEEPASTCILSIIPNLTWDARPYGLIENVVTKKNYRRCGFAGKILEHALNFAWEKGCYKVMLLTGRKEEHVFRLYAGAGFIKEGKTGMVSYSPELRDFIR